MSKSTFGPKYTTIGSPPTHDPLVGDIKFEQDAVTYAWGYPFTWDLAALMAKYGVKKLDIAWEPNDYAAWRQRFALKDAPAGEEVEE